MLPRYLSAQYYTYLPPGFKSWFSFYEAAKPFIEENDDDLDWDKYMDLRAPLIRSSRETTPRYKYSVRYIEKQALDELFELRKLQTFTFEEYQLLQYALQMDNNFPASLDTEMKALQAKVDSLLYEELKKQRS